MPFYFKSLSAALSIIAVAAGAAPGHAQQSPPAAAQEPGAGPQDGPPPSQAPVRAGRARSAAVTASVNLRSGPGTDQEIITTIPAGSTVRVTSCSGEWCEVTWNGRDGYAIARNLSIGAPRQAGPYGPRSGYPGGYGPERQAGGYGPQPGYPGGYGPAPPPGYEAPGYYGPPAVVYGPAYYGPGVYYGPGWGWRRRWGW
jgi:Bacterial SH3 domain